MLHFLFGYYFVEASGSFPERFFNLCNQNGIVLWKLRLRGRELSFAVSMGAWKQARALLEKTGMAVASCQRRGLPAGLFTYRRRYALFLGGGLFLSALCFLSTFVWAIEVTPTKNVNTAEVARRLETLGLREGARKSKLDLPMIYQDMLLQMPELSWIAVNLRGTRAVVEVRPRVMPPQIESREPCDIVAASDGQLLLLEVYEGKAMVPEGSAVQKGDVLVTGCLENPRTGELRHVPARAKALAKIYSRLTAKTPLSMKRQRYTGAQTKRWEGKVFGFRINLSPFSGISYGNYDKISYQHRLSVGGFDFPLVLGEEISRELEEFQVELTQEEAFAFCEQELASQLKRLQGDDTEILETVRRVERGEAVVEISLSCVQEIGVRQERIMGAE